MTNERSTQETRRSQEEFPVAMKILVCGGAGFIGAPLTAQLAGMGHDVRATMHSKEPVRVPGVTYCEVDLTARGEWARLLRDWRPDLVYMVAGKTGGSGLDPLHFVTDNALMHLHLFRAAREFGIVRRIIGMSSTTGYRESAEPVREDSYFTGEPHPAYFNPGHTRRFIERVSAMYPDIETTWLRCGGAFGPGDDFDPLSSHVIAATVRKVAERQNPITVWGDGTATRDCVYIDDLVRALILAPVAPPGAYNIGHGRGMTVNQMLDVLLENANYMPIIKWDESKPQMIANRSLDCTKAEKHMGFKPLIPMREGLARTLKWYEHERR